MPIRATGHAEPVSAVAMRTSQCSASSQPPASPSPFIAAIVGCGSCSSGTRTFSIGPPRARGLGRRYPMAAIEIEQKTFRRRWDHHAHGVVGGDARELLAEMLHHRDRERVPALGAVHDGADALLGADLDLGHRSPGFRCAVQLLRRTARLAGPRAQLVDAGSAISIRASRAFPGRRQIGKRRCSVTITSTTWRNGHRRSRREPTTMREWPFAVERSAMSERLPREAPRRLDEIGAADAVDLRAIDGLCRSPARRGPPRWRS